MDAVIIGAGPAGLTAAYELLTRSSIRPLVLEAGERLGGLAQTVEHHGNRMDIGGHRFFSKSDRVLDWWFRFLPLQAGVRPEETLFYQGATRGLSGATPGPDPATADLVMLLRRRVSRIHYLQKLFAYPIEPNLDTLLKLGPLRSVRILLSYLKAALFPPRKIENLEEFFVSRFGRALYEIFFKTYTEKVWGVPCSALSADWGAQRVKSLSISRALWHGLKSCLPGKARQDRAAVETSLIEQFLYPKLGPGQMWETVAAEVERLGGRILKGARVTRLRRENGRVAEVEAETSAGRETFPADWVFSTMPVRELLRAMSPLPPAEVLEVGDGLIYRDFVTVGLLLDRLELGQVGDGGTVKDNWIYIHDARVDAGRIQIFNNWSPYMVRDPAKAWVGVEYFCDEGDRIWSRTDEEMIARCADELRTLGLTGSAPPLDATVVRMRKAYPAYRGSYGRFDVIRRHLDGIENLFPIGRNGMHRYNNQDHSMLSAMTAVDNILAGRRDRANLWEVNAEEAYHEDGGRTAQAAQAAPARAGA